MQPQEATDRLPAGQRDAPTDVAVGARYKEPTPLCRMTSISLFDTGTSLRVAPPFCKSLPALATIAAPLPSALAIDGVKREHPPTDSTAAAVHLAVERPRALVVRARKRKMGGSYWELSKQRKTPQEQAQKDQPKKRKVREEIEAVFRKRKRRLLKRRMGAMQATTKGAATTTTMSMSSSRWTCSTSISST